MLQDQDHWTKQALETVPILVRRRKVKIDHKDYKDILKSTV